MTSRGLRSGSALTYGARMKRVSRVVSALVLSTALAAAGLGAAEAAPTKVLTKPQMRAALLTVKDLPAGFKLDQSSSKGTGSDDVQYLSNDPGCAALTGGLNGSVDRSTTATRDFTLNHGMEAVQVGLTGFRTAAAVRKDFSGGTRLFRSCHRVGLDMGDGTKLWLAVQQKTVRLDGNQTFVLTMKGRYMSVLMNMALEVSQVRNYEVEVMSLGVNRSAAYESRQATALLRAQTAKLVQHLR